MEDELVHAPLVLFPVFSEVDRLDIPSFTGDPMRDWKDAIGYNNDGTTFEFKAAYWSGRWFAQKSDEPMRRGLWAHLKADPTSILFDKRSSEGTLW